MHKSTDIRSGLRSGLPLVLPTLVVGLSFGVLAQPVMGSIAPILMSLIVFSGAAQFAALTVLTTGGAALAAIAAGMLMNARWLPMGLAVGPFLKGGPVRRALESIGIVDASFALSSNGDGTYDRGVLIGASIPQGMAWVTGTAAGRTRRFAARRSAGARAGRDVPRVLPRAAVRGGADPPGDHRGGARRADRARAAPVRARRRPGGGGRGRGADRPATAASSFRGW